MHRIWRLQIVCLLAISFAAQCYVKSQSESDRIYVAGIFDTESFDWGEEVFEFTTYAINKQQPEQGSSSGWPGQNILRPGQVLDYDVADAACDETTAARAYWGLREENGKEPMHGIVGGRCSGASISMARIAGLEEVPQISPWSTSTRLSDKEEFPFFSRMVGPDNVNGEVGGVIALLRGFDWDRITILNTDTQYGRDLVPELKKQWIGEHSDLSGDWEGQIAYDETIRINENDDVEQDSVIHALESIEDPDVRSRVVVLVAHNQHAYQILRAAEEFEFQPDTIWIGVSSWIGRAAPPPNDDMSSWLPEYPGYLGLTYYYNRNDVYQSFLSEMQEWQQDNGREVWGGLPSVIVEYMVDSIVSLTMALALIPSGRRREGALVTDLVRKQQFQGLSGLVKFTEDGDRANAQFTLLHLRPALDSNDDYYWAEIGVTGTTPRSATINLGDICLHGQGCGLKSAFDDSYPPPKNRAPAWVPVIVVLLLLLFIVVAIKYWRSRKSKQVIREELDAFRDSVVGMRAVEADYIPTMKSSSSELDSTATTLDESGRKTVKIQPSYVRVQWCWQETQHMMDRHDPEDSVGDPADCWIKYDDNSNSKLEAAFVEQGGKGSFSPMDGYVVDFNDMVSGLLFLS